MKRITGIGGIFFNAKDPAALQAWYKKHLGIDVHSWGGAAFTWADEAVRLGHRPGRQQGRALAAAGGAVIQAPARAASS